MTLTQVRNFFCCSPLLISIEPRNFKFLWETRCRGFEIRKSRERGSTLIEIGIFHVIFCTVQRFYSTWHVKVYTEMHVYSTESDNFSCDFVLLFAQGKLQKATTIQDTCKKQEKVTSHCKYLRGCCCDVQHFF